MKTLKESLREPLNEALFNKKNLSSTYDRFIDKGVSELLDYIIDNCITDYIILSIKNPKSDIVDKIILCPDVEHVKKLFKFVEKCKNHNVFISDNTKELSIKRIKEDINNQNCFILNKTTYQTGNVFLWNGTYRGANTRRNPYYVYFIIQDISVLPEINNVNLIL